MISSPRPLRSLGFLTKGLFSQDDPATGRESSGRSSNLVNSLVLIAPSFGIGTCTLGSPHLWRSWRPPVNGPVVSHCAPQSLRFAGENPLRLAEDLATIGILSNGRINSEISVGTPMHYDTIKTGCIPTAPIPKTSAKTVSSKNFLTKSSRTPPACVIGCGTESAA